MKPKILLVDDHAILRSGLRSLIAQSGRCEIAGEAGEGEAALRLVDEVHPDIVVLDIAMPGMNGLEVLRRIGERAPPRPKVILLSAHAEREYVVAALRSGAAGYLLKDSAFEDLLVAIDMVANGRRYLGAGISELAVDAFLGPTGGHAPSAPGGRSDLDKLSPREREVLGLIAESRTNDEIARHIGISVHTVQTYRKRLMEKLGMSRAVDLARFALRHGLVSLD